MYVNSPTVSGIFYELKNYFNLPILNGLGASSYTCSFLYVSGSLWPPMSSLKGGFLIGPVGSYFDLRVLNDTLLLIRCPCPLTSVGGEV